MDFIPEFNPKEILKKLTITKIDTDLTHLNNNQKKVVNLLIKCALVLEDIFYLQRYPDNLKLREEIKKINDPLVLQFYKVMAGPYDHFNDDKPYIKNVKKAGKAGFYPENLTKIEWEQILIEKMSIFHLIRLL